VWREAFKMATLLDGLTITMIDGKMVTHYVHWCSENPKLASHQRTWGEASTVKTRTCMTPNIVDRRAQCMMI
jgi:hypothetical protein